MKLRMLFLMPSHFQWPFLLISFTQPLRWIAAKQTPVQYPRTCPLPPLFICSTYFPTAGYEWKESALGEKSRESAFIRWLWYTYQALCGIISLNPVNELRQEMSSVFHTRGNWSSGPRHLGTSWCTVIPKRGSPSGLKHARVLPLTNSPLDESLKLSGPLIPFL